MHSQNETAANNRTLPRHAPDGTLMNERSAAKFLGISPRKLWGLANAGVIPFIRIGVKSKRYDPKDLEDFIARCRQGSLKQLCDGHNNS